MLSLYSPEKSVNFSVIKIFPKASVSLTVVGTASPLNCSVIFPEVGLGKAVIDSNCRSLVMIGFSMLGLRLIGSSSSTTISSESQARNRASTSNS